MAKKKKNAVGLRSDIPLVQRMQMHQNAQIAEHREDAAQTALKLACVALNDTEGLGFKRICRFAARLREMVSEYYADTEIGDIHLNKRLEQMGFVIGDKGQMLAMMPVDGDD